MSSSILGPTMINLQRMTFGPENPPPSFRLRVRTHLGRTFRQSRTAPRQPRPWQRRTFLPITNLKLSNKDAVLVKRKYRSRGLRHDLRYPAWPRPHPPDLRPSDPCPRLRHKRRTSDERRAEPPATVNRARPPTTRPSVTPA